MDKAVKGIVRKGMTADSVYGAAARLRACHAETLAQMPLKTVIAALCEVGARWQDPAYSLRREAEAWTEPFPWVMVEVSLHAPCSAR